MTLDQLEAVQAIVDKGSFRAAAEFLHRSQPALSASVKNLEDEFDIQLFDRASYRPTLTEAGALFVQAAAQTLEAARLTARTATELGKQKAQTKLIVSVDALAPMEAIALMAGECARPVVPATLVLNKTILQGSLSDLLGGSIELALAPSPKDDSAIEKIALCKVTLVGTVSRKLLQEKRKPDAAFLKNHAQVFVYDRYVDAPPDELMPNASFKGGGRKIYTPDHATKRSLILNGIGWGRISQAEFDQADDVVLIDTKLCEPTVLEMCLMRPKFRSIGPVAKNVWRVFEEMAAKKPGDGIFLK